VIPGGPGGKAPRWGSRQSPLVGVQGAKPPAGGSGGGAPRLKKKILNNYVLFNSTNKFYCTKKNANIKSINNTYK